MWNKRFRKHFSSTVLSTITGTISFALSVVLSPLAACWRSLQWLVVESRMNAYEFAHLLIRRNARQGASTSLEFLKTYMKEHERLVRCYEQGHYGSLSEAQVALTLFRMAEADLLARAQQAVPLTDMDEEKGAVA